MLEETLNIVQKPVWHFHQHARDHRWVSALLYFDPDTSRVQNATHRQTESDIQGPGHHRAGFRAQAQAQGQELLQVQLQDIVDCLNLQVFLIERGHLQAAGRLHGPEGETHPLELQCQQWQTLHPGLSE